MISRSIYAHSHTYSYDRKHFRTDVTRTISSTICIEIIIWYNIFVVRPSHKSVAAHLLDDTCTIYRKRSIRFTRVEIAFCVFCVCDVLLLFCHKPLRSHLAAHNELRRIFSRNSISNGSANFGDWRYIASVPASACASCWCTVHGFMCECTHNLQKAPDRKGAMLVFHFHQRAIGNYTEHVTHTQTCACTQHNTVYPNQHITYNVTTNERKHHFSQPWWNERVEFLVWKKAHLVHLQVY